jgi:hypothetical protein
MFSTGDVVSFFSEEAEKRKFHLCISVGGYFLFINSPKSYRSFPTDFRVDARHLPFLEERPEGYSIVSCSLVMRKTRSELLKMKAKREGVMPVVIMRELFAFIEASDVIEPATKAQIIDELADWI